MISQMNRLMAQISRDDVNIPKGSLSAETIASMLRIVFGVAGGIAVLIITIAAFQYVMSAGNPQSTAKAKDTIMYALIGLVICMTAFTIITFVLGRI